MTHNEMIAPNVTRNQIMKFAELADAIECSNSSTRTYRVNVVLGNQDDPRPYWVADSPRTAGRLIKAGFQYA